MIIYYRNLPVVLIGDPDPDHRRVRLGGGEEVTVPRNETSNTPYGPEPKESYQEPNPEVGRPGTGVSSDGKPFPSTRR